MKLVWFFLGATFFLCWPIASIFPKYRYLLNQEDLKACSILTVYRSYLVSPFKWCLWDIPTNGTHMLYSSFPSVLLMRIDEWSFRYLRRQAQLSREQMINQKVANEYDNGLISVTRPEYTGQTEVPQIVLVTDRSNDSESDSDWHSTRSTASIIDSADFLSFRAKWHGVNGHLIIYSSGVRFVRSLRTKEMWKLPFLEMAEMRKLQGSKLTQLTFTSPEQLEFEHMDGSTILVESLKGRDEVFNSIIGFSNLQWQSLQTGGGKGGNKARNLILKE